MSTDMNKWRFLAATAAIGVLVTGCGSDSGSDGGSGSRTEGKKAASGPALPTADKLAADPGKRYTSLKVPQLDGMTCDKGDGGFRFGSDRDLMVAGDDGLPQVKTSEEDQISCFGASRITLSKGGMRATVPHLTSRTTLYRKVADPARALDKVFARTMHLAQGYGRNPVGTPQSFTTADLMLKCQQNVTDTFPMTTCFWADYGAIGVVDFFPPAGAHVPVDEAAVRTRKLALGVLGA
ncbi:hypothetical protein [Streptomyces sp. MST-110588]|uniref:hypothetical protein n=1 Tax=Streptomyces sp. MST-110588 TaxID=2833628 RepID=UPI001F5C1D75|nr:hypothetical protein [Streptomyces sp. MST-110588]UNO42351.1 hypothetical protein KGS77_26040 [Streptomyces sp. MST-110588]